ncbi:MAG: radical SAM protein, partial [Anaerolineales bacterium]
YDSLEGLALLDGIIDIYMPDMKYASRNLARKYSHIPNYPSVNQTAVKEMYRQVGNLQLDENGIAQKGLLIRHLVLPNQIAGSEKILQFIAEQISTETYLNIMDQYYPTYLAHKYPELNRTIRPREVQKVLELAHALGFRHTL